MMPLFRNFAAAIAAILLFSAAASASDDDTDSGPDAKKMKRERALAVVPKTKEQLRVPDDVLRRSLAEAFAATKTIDPFIVQVDIKDGEITLRGKVRSLAEKNLAEAVARTTPGARAVRANLAVVPKMAHPWPSGDVRDFQDLKTDDTILKEVRKKVAASGAARLTDLKIEVYLGVVVVSGPVADLDARDKLRDVILYAEGVRTVVNHTWVKE